GYRSSPFFEYFEDEIRPVFEKKHIFLLDLNFEAMLIVSKCLRMKLDFETTTEYFGEADSNTILDFRTLANGKKDDSQFEPYTQVFEEKHGFLNNLSVLDLLFNEGKYALDYLKNQKLILK
ncbi:MAG TPA: WbqC family protein, partial [Flavobacterium sp.]|nr:WbqC family protein [Flavobacterium sp.]